MIKQMKTPTKTKTAMAAEARQRGEKTFLARCNKHGDTTHHTCNGKCVSCGKELASNRWKNTRNNPEALAKHNERQRDAMTKLREKPEQRAKDRNARAISRLRKLGRPMSTPDQLSECLELIKAAPIGCDMDHAVPLKGIHPVTGEWVVSGLHVAWNLEPMQPRSNKRKRDLFDPEAFWFQRPYNSFPGGQFHGDVGEIELIRYTVDGGVALELMTEEEFRAAVIEMGNEAMNDELIKEAA